MAGAAGFSDSLEHVLAELARIDLLLEAQVAVFRGRLAARPDDLGAYYVSDAEVATLLAPAPAVAPAREAAPGARAAIDARVAATSPGVDLRLPRLRDAFGLSPAELDAVLLALAPEADRRYERLFGYLHDDLGQRQPGVDLILDLVTGGAPGKLALRAMFAPSAPLARHGLLIVGRDPAAPAGSLLGSGVRLAPRVARFLLEPGDEPDELLRGLAELIPAAATAAGGSPGSGAGAGAAQRTAARDGAARDGAAAGRPAFAEAAEADDARELALGRAAAAGRPLLHAWGERIGTPPPGDFAGLLTAVDREARLAGACLWWSGADALAEAAQAGELARVARELGDRALVSGPARPAAFAGLELVEVTAPPGRRRERSRARLGALARLVPPRHGWDDLVLHPDRGQQLREIADRVRCRATVHDEWGFGAAVASGRGLNVLFAGPSGTGKTMAATVLASSLGLDLFAVDVSALVSKYIGETEKHLAQVFDAAAAGEGVLFFDEADAIFGKRTAVRDAHDRYANVQTSYLLQRLEDHEGLVVLATNLRKNMDEAFVRRLHAVVDFPVPTPEQRRLIWARLWPAAAPLDPGLDLDRLAAEVDLPGGHLRNIAVSAAFGAAADGGVITAAHLDHAIRREYQHLGKITPPARRGAG
ncbi:MAG TPA: ATP-binding protein [Trebonia sp.]|nr:ATP-binding protein [Trebonia sp.]